MLVRSNIAQPTSLVRPFADPPQEGAQDQPAIKDYHFQKAIRGWISRERGESAEPGGAYILDDFFPTENGIRVRGGTPRYATLPTEVTSIFDYDSGGVKKIFATNETEVYDITVIVDPDTELLPASADIQAQTGGFYSTVQYTQTAGTFLMIVNGQDTPQNFDGTVWSTTPLITGPADITSLSYVWVHGSRLWFIDENTRDVWYLPVDAIGGPATLFVLQGIFRDGGNLLFGASWSIDAGDGISNKVCFFSDNGEVAVYTGTDPASADFAIQGVYKIGNVLGFNAQVKSGGDLVIATEEGFIPLTAAIQKDKSVAGLSSYSRNIEPDWKRESARRKDPELKWSAVSWPSRNMILIALPTFGTLNPIAFAYNLRTGALSQFTNWDTRCTVVFDDDLYFGTSNGRVLLGDNGGNDDGSEYVATYVGLFEPCGAGFLEKTAHSMRPRFIENEAFNYVASMQANVKVNLPEPPDPVTIFPGTQWDAGQWDSFQWAGVQADKRTAIWQTATAEGDTLAPAIQIPSNSEIQPIVELTGVDFKFTLGEAEK